MTHDEIAAYYEQLPAEGGFDSFCKMTLPGGLDGRNVLDLGCRRGQGVYKLSDLVGPTGSVIGVDWRDEFIERARSDEAHALEKNGLTQSNMKFIVAYPEELDACGIEAESLDVVYINSVLSLFFDPAEALKQVARLLKPAGLLVCQTVLATRPRNEDVVAEARMIGNAVQSAPFRKDFAKWLNGAGMDMPTYETAAAGPVSIEMGVDDEASAPVVQTDERVSFSSETVNIRKLGGFDYQAYLRDDISLFR